MNLVRLFLSCIVVIFHNSTWLGVAGYSAVFGFFIISGYGNWFVVDKVYSKKIGNYYVNRFLKIYPLYLVVVILSLMVMKAYGRAVVINDKEYLLWPNAIDSYSVNDIVNELTFGIFKNYRYWCLTLTGFPTVITAAWSDTIEFSFYLILPLLVKATRKKQSLFYCLFLTSGGYFAYLLITGKDFTVWIYRSFLGCFFIFLVGAFMYYFEEQSKEKLDRNHIDEKVLLGCVFLLFFFYIILFAWKYPDNTLLDMRRILASIFLLAVMIWMSKNLHFNRSVNALLGRASVGIFMSQRLVRAILLLILYRMNSYKLNNIFGVGENRFALCVLITSALMGTGIAYIVEKPIDGIRDKIRNAAV